MSLAAYHVAFTQSATGGLTSVSTRWRHGSSRAARTAGITATPVGRAHLNEVGVPPDLAALLSEGMGQQRPKLWNSASDRLGSNLLVRPEDRKAGIRAQRPTR